MDANRHFCVGPLLCLLGIVLLTACSSPTPTQSASSARQTVRNHPPTPAPGAPHCHPPSPITPSKIGIPEVRGTSSGQTELWALLFQPLIAKQEVKIVWSMTGNGDLRIVARGPDGTSIQPEWLQSHTGSNWARPGEEWGTGFILPRSGCWNFHASLGDASGDVWLLVK